MNLTILDHKPSQATTEGDQYAVDELGRLWTLVDGKWVLSNVAKLGRRE